MLFSKTLSILAAVSFGSVAFAAPLESSANHLEARCGCEDLPPTVSTGLTTVTGATLKLSE